MNNEDKYRFYMMWALKDAWFLSQFVGQGARDDRNNSYHKLMWRDFWTAQSYLEDV